MLRLVLLVGWQAWKRLEGIFDSTFEPACLFALLGLVLSGLLLNLHVRVVPSSPVLLLVRWEGQVAGASLRSGSNPQPDSAKLGVGTISALDEPALHHRSFDE
jgi:hypothetical protein